MESLLQGWSLYMRWFDAATVVSLATAWASQDPCSGGYIFNHRVFCKLTRVIFTYSCVSQGVNVVLTLVKRFGALTAVTVTNVRKVSPAIQFWPTVTPIQVFTIILSWMFFPKPFVFQ